MNSFIIYTLFLIVSFNTYSKAENIIFPNKDIYLEHKKEALNEIQELMGTDNPLEIIAKSNRVLLWTTQAKVLPDYDNPGSFKSTQAPSFTAATEENSLHLRKEIELQCECSLKGKDIIGILIAHPLQAAKMFFRHGWGGRKGNELDGLAPPITIIYHELAHVKDYLINPEFFFDSAANLDPRWKNLAEQSAVQQQNDFTRALAQKGLFFSTRRSYGRNELYFVENLFSIEPLSQD